jgi:hypothetical protein
MTYPVPPPVLETATNEHDVKVNRAWAAAAALVVIAIVTGPCVVVTARVLHSAPAVCQKIKVKVETP